MNDIVRIPVIAVHQPIGLFYISKMNALKLISLAYSDIRRMEGKDDKFMGVQRSLRKSKVSKIKKYLESFDATFPNSIVLSIESKNIVKKEENFIEINDSQDVFSIIDGQHRLAGLDGEDISKDFDLIVTIFEDLNDAQQANLFSTINSEQSKVDSSLKYNLELESDLYTPRKFIALLTQAFNSFEKSPLKGLLKDDESLLSVEETPFESIIKTLGSNSTQDQKKDTILSGSGFAREIEYMLYDDDDYFEIRNLLYHNQDKPRSHFLNNFKYDRSRYILWEYYLNDDIKGCFKILYEYFSSFQSTFPVDWANKESMLTKTTGYGAMVRLFKVLYKIGKDEKKELDYEFFNQYIMKLKSLEGKINSNSYQGSGESAVNELLKDFRALLQV